MTSSTQRATALGLAAIALLALTACGGGGGLGGGNDGTRVVRTNLIVTGVVDDGTPTSPLPGASCTLRDAQGASVTSGVADDAGSLRLIVPPQTRGFTSCAPAGLPSLVMRAFLSTQDQSPGGELDGQDVLPAYTPLARILQQELADAPQLDAEARAAALLAGLQTDAALGLLGNVATELFNLLLDNGLDRPFEIALLDLYEDGSLDADGYDAVLTELDALVTAAETEYGLTLEAAYLQAFPPLDLTVLHHSGAESALRFYAETLPDFGGAARFATLMADLREAAGGAVLAVSAGDHIGPSAEFAAMLNLQEQDLNAAVANAIDYDVFGVGTRDFGFGPGIFSAFIRELDDDDRFVSSNLSVAQEFQLSAVVRDNRLVPLALLDINGRRIGIVGALDEDFRNRTTARSAGVSTPASDSVQAAIDTLSNNDVDIILLISQMRDLDADLALLGELSGVDLMIAAGDDAILAAPGDVLIPGDAAHVVGTYPLLEPDLDGTLVPVVSTAGRFGYIGRVRLRFDPTGALVDVLEGAPVRVAGGAEPDAVEPDPGVVAAALEPLQAELDRLATVTTATTAVELDARAAQLTTRDTNFGNLVADAVLGVTQIVRGQFGAPLADAAIIDGASIGADAVIASGTVLSNTDGNDLVDPSQIIGVLSQVSSARLKEILEHAVAQGGGPAFLQLANLEVVWDPSGTPQELDADGSVLVEGTRIRSVTASGTALVTDGEVVAGAPALDIATSAFIANGGRGHPVAGLTMVNVGETMATAFNVYLTSFLDGNVAAATYPAGGLGRIQQTAP